MRRLLLLAFLMVSACAGPMVPPGGVQQVTAPAAAPRDDLAVAARDFAQVVDRMKPVIEQSCRVETPGLNCDFLIVVDDRRGIPPNAFQTVDQRSGRPVIGLTLSLIAEARNRDELAFVLGHEAGHHIAGHIPRRRDSALAGALILGTLASLGGADAASVRTAQNLGADLGARRYSQEFELEADAWGTVLAHRAGFDPERGAAFFGRIPDPGHGFLSTHPPNAQRMAMVARTAAALRRGEF